ncbi:MAG: S8 family peptidase [Sarcina ventriculi]|nr:S8 family peptidase [Sarcina ventriculi]
MKADPSAPNDLFINPMYKHYVAQYQGDIISQSIKNPYIYATIIDDKYAIVSIPVNNSIDTIQKDIPAIVFIKRGYIYTLETITVMTAANINLLHLDNPLSLFGNGVLVGLVDTGIDYLNPEFMFKNGETRIHRIWDQTLPTDTTNQNVPFGVEYTKEQITDAINASKSGGNPYDIVNSKDTIGHGTSMAGVIGATGINPNLQGAAPNCEFAVVKLAPYINPPLKTRENLPIFDLTSISSAITYLVNYALNINTPMVVYIPLGSNLGNHNGEGILEDIIDTLSINRGIVMVTGSGNQANKGYHTSGMLSNPGDFNNVQLYISPEQKNLLLEFWISEPHKLSLSILSPSGESTGVIPSTLNSQDTNTFIFEQTTAKISYSIPEQLSGDELITVFLDNIQSGTWTFKLNADYTLNGVFNAWIPQEGITVGNTQFLSPIPYNTVTSPGTSKYIITVACYNQNNDNIVISSGTASLNNIINVLDLAAGGVNVQTIGANSTTISIVNGTSVSAAVVAGACALLLEWGIINGNDPNIYSQSIKYYLTGGTRKRSGDVYPNPQWGFGILDMIKVFRNMT